jgi:hypothetical protein
MRQCPTRAPPLPSVRTEGDAPPAIPSGRQATLDAALSVEPDGAGAVRQRAMKRRTMNNMKQIILGLRDYHDTYITIGLPVVWVFGYA